MRAGLLARAKKCEEGIHAFWRIAAFLLAAMVVPTAAAEMEIQLDLDTATLDELIVARDAISALH